MGQVGGLQRVAGFRAGLEVKVICFFFLETGDESLGPMRAQGGEEGNNSRTERRWVESTMMCWNTVGWRASWVSSATLAKVLKHGSHPHRSRHLAIYTKVVAQWEGPAS